MKRTLALVALLIAGSMPLASQASQQTEWQSVQMHAPVPCSAACPYWVDDWDAACVRDPVSIPGSWADFRVPVPESSSGRLVLDAQLLSAVDYDGFLCRVHARGTASERWEAVGTFSNLLLVATPCAGDPLPVGCPESGSFLIEPGGDYVVRAFNWSDPGAATLKYRFFSI